MTNKKVCDKLINREMLIKTTVIVRTHNGLLNKEVTDNTK